MKNVPELENKNGSLSKVMDEKLSECFSESMEELLPDYLDFSPEGTFHNSCDFSGTDPSGRDFYTVSSGGFSRNFSSSVERLSAGSFDISG
jgi:hypothetical protein